MSMVRTSGVLPGRPWWPPWFEGDWVLLLVLVAAYRRFYPPWITIRQAIAKIIELAKAGECSPDVLCEKASKIDAAENKFPRSFKPRRVRAETSYAAKRDQVMAPPGPLP
jgi:hypothetical protein